ncbi:hypothetical protein JQ617_07915 [Bradyrhizobium sp. KB893862 SZCCT0404]|uniref:hypothetical protein n=1 Tax=Bradyrhizobium sp. KB893862 SZCCT0404 TaxID=2807672 RepID=UPI001BA6969C|nr:hypothetical protein [Bradyrhizobium sp. KB893862 SZCCT0404]MBR1173876.1 hypothetical protein [Bradyrhizobium sp. KB893862 SZCCT0404]
MNTLNLRPIIYKTRDSAIFRSGWLALTTGSIFTEAAEGGEFVLVAGARPAFKVGHRVTFRAAVDLYPSDFIEAGERGIVSGIDPASGTVSILLEGMHAGLGDNTLTITPHHDDATLAAVERLRVSAFGRPTPINWRSKGLALSTLLITLPITELLRPWMPGEAGPSFFMICAVAWASVALGQRSALLLALVTPYAYNIVCTVPHWHLTPWQPYEFVLAAAYIGVALTFPALVRAGRRFTVTESA